MLAPILLMINTSCVGRQDEQALNINNLLEYGIEINNDIFAPTQVEFGMTIDEVLKAKSLDSKAYSEDEVLGKRIIQTVNIANLSDEMTVIYTFDKGKLVFVEYVIAASDAEKTTVCNSLYTQLTKKLPTPAMNTLEDVKKGKNTVLWIDKEKNSISVSFPITLNDEPNAIILSIGVADISK